MNLKRSCDPQSENGPPQKRLPDKSEHFAYEVLAKQKTKLEEEQQKLYQKQKEMVEKKEGEIKSLQGTMETQRKLVEEKEKKLTKMENEMENMQTQITEKDEELTKKSNALKRESKKLRKKKKALKQQQHEYKVLEQEKTKLEKELRCKVQMLDEEQRLHQEQKEKVEKKEGEVVSLQGKIENQTRLNEEKKKKLAEMEEAMEEMKTQIMVKDEALTEKGNALKRENGKFENVNKALRQQQHEYKVLEQEKTKLEEGLRCKVQMLGEQERRHQEQKEMVKKKEGELVSLQRKMKNLTKFTEEEMKKLTEMKKEMEKMKTQLMEKDTKMITMQKNQHKVEELLENVQEVVRTVRYFNAGGERLQEINKSSYAEEDIKKSLMEGWKQSYKQVDTSGTVIWSGTVKIPDSQKTVFDCSIKVHTLNKGIKSLFPLKQLTMRILPSSVEKSLYPYQIQLRRLILCTDENTDMMSYSAFSQAVRLGSDMRGCVVLKNTESALHLLCLSSYSSDYEDDIKGFIIKYPANDTVLGILTSHGLLPCVNSQHGLAKQNAMLKEELQNKDKMLNEQQKLNQEQVEMHKKKIAEKEEEIVKLHQEVEEQKRMAEKKQEELATSQHERDMMKTAISEKDAEIIVKDITMMENDEALKRKDRELLSHQCKIMELQNEKEQVEEQLHRVLMKDRCWDADREINTEEDTDKALMMETARLELENEVAMKQAALDKIDKMMENDFKCSICSQLFIKTTTLNCSHSFCAFCIQKWLSEKGTCPHCRTGVTASVCSVVVDNLVETIIDKLGDEAKERRKVTVREREYDISMQKGRHLCSIPEDMETEDETSTVSSPCSSLSHLSPAASLMSPYSCPPSSASTWSRSPASIANIFSPPSVLSTNSPSPACNGSNN